MELDRLNKIFTLLFPILYVNIISLKKSFAIFPEENLKKSVRGNETENLGLQVVGCKWFKGCVDTANFDIFNGKVYLCENCEKIAEPLVRFPISSLRNNTLVSLTEGIIESKDSSESSKVQTIDKLNTLSSGQKRMIVYWNFKPMNKIECKTNNENQQKFDFEFFVQYNQKKYDLVIDINMGEVFSVSQNESRKVVSEWNLNKKNKNNSIYFFKTIERNSAKERVEYVSELFFLGRNDTLQLLELICHSKRGCNEDQFKVFATISCPKNGGNILEQLGINKVNTNRKLKINDVIMLVKVLKRNSTSKRYISRIKLFMETLLKVLEKKMKSEELSYKCTSKILEWVKELCVSLGISFDHIFKSDSYFSRINNTDKIKEFEKDKVTYHIKSEVSVEQYMYLEDILSDS
ncbi:signal peptide protein [Cryptosporidium ryanae]|uniref:signal peptide protein n=1 Tax=Cryptosporidium ryanae TaxID=515981 RepID=UPI00351A3CFC|nr:signal peptide protein [Cryptosporidium ryanae]